jgi:hypothetical protein
MPWWLRGLAAAGVLVLFALSAGAEAAGAVAWYATLGAAAGLWSGPRSYVLGGSTAGRYGAVLFMTVWLLVWTVSTVWLGGRLPVVLGGGRTLRGVLGLPAQAMWRPALPAGFTSEHAPEGVIVVRPAEGAQEAWVIASGMVTVREGPDGSALGVTFAGNAAELTAAPEDDDNEELTCQLALLGEDTREPGRDRYVLLSSRNDPTGSRELGLWLAANARIPFDDRIAE